MNPTPRYLPWCVAALAAGYLVMAMVPPSDRPGEMQLYKLASVPVVDGGRVKPLDTAARTSLLVITDKQTFQDKSKLTESERANPRNKGEKQPAIRWLLDVMTSRMGENDRALKHEVFHVLHDQVLGLVGLQPREGFRYAAAELAPKIDKLEDQANRSEKLPRSEQDHFHREVIKLARQLKLYMELSSVEKPILIPAASSGDDWKNYPAANRIAQHIALERIQAEAKRLGITDIKKATDEQAQQIMAMYGAELDRARAEQNPALQSWGEILRHYRNGDVEKFNKAVADYRQYVARVMPKEFDKASFETFFNHFEPFYRCSVLYVGVFALICLSWLGWTEPLYRSALSLLGITLVVHTFALLARMYLLERPFVFIINLYSTAIFIGWGCAVLGLVLEWIYRNGIGSIVAAMTGFVTLIIAHNLADGDTLEMMQAVLDTNLWLATHVTCINTGYAGTLLASTLGIVFVLRGVLTRSLDRESMQMLTRMIYGSTCFAILFSFTGTVLGGIWADQSWGRFWGWDPKENGALMIVLWNALTLHARWGGIVKQRGLALLAIAGNIFVVWSWFGVNNLGVGLHAYGLITGAWFWIGSFILSQLVLIGIGLIPLRYWRSFAQPPE